MKVCIRIPKKTLINLKRKKLDAEEHNKYLIHDQIIEALEDYLKKKQSI